MHILKHPLTLLAAGLQLLLSQCAAASVIGFLGNFDVINDTGKVAHGFEIELEGLHASDITDTFGGLNRGFPSGRGFDPATAVQRYGAPTITEYSNGGVFGTKVTYLGTYDGSQWDYGTPFVAGNNFITPGDNCWTGGGLGYGPDTPCDHFGVGTSANPTKTTYNWLLETATPGVLSNGLVALPAPVFTVVPPAVVGDPPQVMAAIAAPDPLGGFEFGDALWVKVYTTEFEDDVNLEDLVAGNPHVDQAETEVEWQLLQKEFNNPLSGMLESGLAPPMGPNAASILRRYEYYQYAGEYDQETHEALVNREDGHGDSNPVDSDVGHYLGAQNAAVNLNGNPGQPAAVPAPPELALLLPGLLGLVWLRARKDARGAR